MTAQDKRALTDAQDRALLGLSYLWPIHEHYLVGRLSLKPATIDELVERGLAFREIYKNERGGELPLVMLTVAGAKRRQARTSAKDADPQSERWRDRMEADLSPAVES